MSWFATWFDSPYYHLLYKNRDEKEAQVFIDNLIEKLQLKKGSKLIDIACGKGRHATYFNKKFLSSTASMSHPAKIKSLRFKNLLPDLACACVQPIRFAPSICKIFLKKSMAGPKKEWSTPYC